MYCGSYRVDEQPQVDQCVQPFALFDSAGEDLTMTCVKHLGRCLGPLMAVMVLGSAVLEAQQALPLPPDPGEIDAPPELPITSEQSVISENILLGPMTGPETVRAGDIIGPADSPYCESAARIRSPSIKQTTARASTFLKFER